MAGTFDISTINVISPNGLVTKAITASDTGYLNVPSPQFADAINLTSGQIKFPATQVPSSDANILDDYEEGTWTPSINFGGGNTGIVYGIQIGTYVKIGKMVCASFRIELFNKGSSTGTVRLVFPFTAGISSHAVSIGYAINYSTYAPTTGFIFSESNFAYLENVSGAQTTDISNTHFTNTSYIYGTATYVTDV